MSQTLTDETKVKIDTFLSELHLNIASVPGTGKTPLTEEAVIKLITRFIVSICTAWWSISELVDYIRGRKTFSDIMSKLS